MGAFVGESEDAVPTPENLSHLKFISAIIKEALRMNPPVNAAIPREALHDVILCDYYIPKGVRR